MERPQVVIEIAESLAREVANGGVFVSGCTLAINDECALVVRGPVEEIELPARVVYVDPNGGAGLELVGFSPALREHLTTMFTAWLAEPAPHGTADQQLEPAAAPQEADEHHAAREEAAEHDVTADHEATDVPAEDDEDEADPERRRKALTLHERLRGLTMSQQIKLAQVGDQQERIMLERYYNKNVWEPLLRNPKLTSPEVARISRMGTLPRVLLEVIVNNGTWLQVPEVRRALLSNPRLGTDQILRVLRMLPKHELKLASMQTAYPFAVRDAAKRLLKEHEK